MRESAAGPRSGVLLPLFSCPSSESWGIGDIGDLLPVATWLAGAGQRVLQLLPLNEMAPGQHSPYSALSAMAIDPIYIRVGDVPEFVDAGGESALTAGDRGRLDAVRRARSVQYDEIRSLKLAALGAAFDRFRRMEWDRQTDRAKAFGHFLSAQAWWVEDYGLFRAIHAREGERSWTEWSRDLQDREPKAINGIRRDLSRDVLFRQFLQWVADAQWRRARAAVSPMAVFGDLPFMVDTDSADVWVRQHEFQVDVSLGVPPDAFSATGQDWGMPVYRWDAMAADDFRWLRERARRAADLFDGYRVDHLVGFYRTYGRPKDGGPPFFTPDTEPAQVALGEQVLEVFRSAGCEIIAEDLGTVPDFVRDSLARLGVPGFRILRWERLWHAEGQPFRDPSEYPANSVAASGTHDTDPMVVWWEGASDDDRRRLNEIPLVRQLAGDLPLPASGDDSRVRDTLIEALFASGSNLVLLPIQDVFGWRDRINEPATVTPVNWTFRLPWPADRLGDEPEARARQQALRGWADRHNRR